MQSKNHPIRNFCLGINNNIVVGRWVKNLTLLGTPRAYHYSEVGIVNPPDEEELTVKPAKEREGSSSRVTGDGLFGRGQYNRGFRGG